MINWLDRKSKNFFFFLFFHTQDLLKDGKLNWTRWIKTLTLNRRNLS